MKTLKYLTVFLIVFLNLTFLKADDFIIQAMRDEIKRSLTELQLQNLKKPYYIEYKLVVRNSSNVKSTLGNITESNSLKTAQLSVGLRVGTYKFDNSNFFDFGFSLFGSGDDEESFKNRTIPVELDYPTLRRELWLATDAAYKQTSEIFAKKEAVIKNRIIKDTTHDFIELAPETTIDTISLESFPQKKFEELTKKLSSIFKNYPEINVSAVGVEYLPETIYYLNSEGREYIKNDYYYGLEAVASTQSSDGMPLSNYFTAFAKRAEDFPSDDSLYKAIENMALKLKQLSNAETLDEPYSGPVLFTQEAAAGLFAQVFAPNLVTQREQMTEQGFQDNERHTAFQSKIGGRVLPEFLGVSAQPSLKQFQKTILMGHNLIDDEGVKTEDVELVKDGYLKNLLSSRVPTKRVRKSNGHQFGGAAMLSSIFLESKKSNSKSEDELIKKMMKLCKDRELPFGIIVKRVLDQNVMFTTLFRLTSGDFPMTQMGSKVPLLEVYKVFPDGKKILLRGVEAKGFTPQSFKDILLTGNRPYAMNYLASAVTSPFMTGGSQYIPASMIVPDLLFEDGEIRSVESDFPKPPILSNPVGKK